MEIINNIIASVYITNHNYGKYIQKAIDSVLNQSFKNFELIIIDDGSEDNSRKIIELYRTEPKVKIIFQQKKGLNITNNIAINASTGKYIMRLDADDFLDENALLIMVNKLESDESLVMVFPDYYLVDKDDNILVQERRHNFQNVTIKDQPAHGACTMFRKEILIEVGSYYEEFECQDGYDIWLKVISRNYKIENINLPLFYYRQHGENLTKNQEKILKTRHEIIKKNINVEEIKNKKHIAIVPVRGGEANSPLALRKFNGSTLLDICINGAIQTENITFVILTSSDTRIIKHSEQNYGDKIITVLRPESLSGLNVKLEGTIDYLFNECHEHLSCVDTVTLVNFEYPLRKYFYIDKSINTLYLYGVDSVISVKQVNANFYRHEGAGLVPFDTNRDLRLERNMIYEETGGIHTFKFSSYSDNKSIISGQVGHVIIDELSTIRVLDQKSFDIAEYFHKQKCERG